MNDTEKIMFDIYNTLVQIRYPKITTAVAENVEITILSGENRISLLCWLLTEKSPTIATELQNLKGAALEEKLLEYYSNIGICINKKLLLGNCSLQEQLSTLRLILDFMECMYIESSNIDHNEKESINDILQVYINENSDVIASNIKPKLSHSESMQYFDNLKKYVAEHQKLNSNYEYEKEKCVEEHKAQTMEDKRENNEDDRNLLFTTEKDKFMEAFSTIGSWPMFKEKNAKHVKNTLHSMDTDIKDIYSNFSSLTQFLQAKNEIFNATIPKGLNKIISPLNEIVEETIIFMEETSSVNIDNY